ncbi:MFS transporter [Erwinia tasmaniensis]|uniref:MFS transporter n=1 Tax=Erwinia tasmaniensis TaxID=338565 RepID=UPI003A4E070A
MTHLEIPAEQPNPLTVIHTMLAGTFLSRAGYFMVWPYLSVELYRHFHLSASLIGAIFFLTSAFGIFTGVLASYYSDRLGRNLPLITSLMLSIAGFAIMAFSDHTAEYVAAMMLVATGRASTETFSKAMIGDYIADIRQREKYQYIRYYVVNIGSALGPLAGTYALSSPVLNIFFVSCAVYSVYTLALLCVLKKVKKLVKQRRNKLPSFSQSVLTILSHTTFSRLLLCYFLVMFVYISFDSPLIQAMTRMAFTDLNAAISLIFIVNAITVVALQYPVLYLLKKWSMKSRIQLGVTIISVSQLLFLTIQLDLIEWLVFSVFVLSVGELITMPAFSVEVDRLAPDDLRGTSFGLINLTSLGTALCPLFCGFFIDAGFTDLMFISLFLLGGVAISIYSSTGQGG